jgi:hypothetical protein
MQNKLVMYASESIDSKPMYLHHFDEKFRLM